VKQFWSLDVDIQLKRVATSFPHQYSVDFCNSTAHNGRFVILSGRGWNDYEN